jgi:hypothetical protein
MRNAWRILTGKPEGVILHGKYRRKWKLILKLIVGYEEVDWIHMAQNKFQWGFMQTE